MEGAGPCVVGWVLAHCWVLRDAGRGWSGVALVADRWGVTTVWWPYLVGSSVA